MPYEHHVFISYAHGDLWTPYVKKLFAPHLNAYLGNRGGPIAKQPHRYSPTTKSKPAPIGTTYSNVRWRVQLLWCACFPPPTFKAIGAAVKWP